METLLSVQFKIMVKNANTLRELKRHKDIYGFFEIGGKRQLDPFLSNDDNKSSSKADNDDYYYYYCSDVEDEDDYTEDVHKVNAVISIYYI